MPYIKQEDRQKFDESIKDISSKVECAGDLNYVFTAILHHYINKKGLRYATLNEVHGMLDCCNKELYRKITGPYENLAIDKNGDMNIINMPTNKEY